MSAPKWKTKLAFSAGGVMFRKEGDRILVVLTARPGRRGERVWCLPKGIIESKESVEEAALREVKEETGLDGEVVEKLDQIDYWFYWKPEMARYHKTVYFFLIKYVGGDTGDHDEEVEAVEWFPIEEAFEMLEFENEVSVMKKAEERIRQGELSL